MTTRLRDVETDGAPADVPLTVTVVVPLAILGSVAMVRVVVHPFALLAVVGLKLQEAPVGSPEQLKLTVPLKPLTGVIVIVLEVFVPADTLVGLSAVAPIVKLLCEAATTRLTIVELEGTPAELPLTVTVVVPAAVLESVAIVRVVVHPFALVTVVGLKVQEAPEGSPEQVKLTVPPNLLPGVTVIVLEVLVPAETLVGLKAVADIEKPDVVSNQAVAR